LAIRSGSDGNSGESDSGMVIGGLRPVAEALILTWD
jgi:hypothetical protein